MDDLIAASSGIFVAALVICFAMSIMHPPESISLRLDSWQCSKSEQREVERCMKGCRMYMETVCTQWTAK